MAYAVSLVREQMTEVEAKKFKSEFKKSLAPVVSRGPWCLYRLSSWGSSAAINPLPIAPGIIASDNW